MKDNIIQKWGTVNHGVFSKPLHTHPHLEFAPIKRRRDTKRGRAQGVPFADPYVNHQGVCEKKKPPAYLKARGVRTGPDDKPPKEI